MSVQPRKEDTGHLRAALSLLQPGVDVDHDAQPLLNHKPEPKPKVERPSWCKCDCCAPSSLLQEELCCRRSDGACITSSPLFERLVLHRPLLEAVLLYHDPLSAPASTSQSRVHTPLLTDLLPAFICEKQSKKHSVTLDGYI
ncbi:P2X purinoceptor 7-like [Lates calcarifer]|uniref:P2X purinoceptor 7-like n=1 Tax=Lates calcarifer TaxID=8187 RepID=A0AAJ7LR25_LATCA|nr:P2X purinoceptor 7-like [Lates calcarifer]